MKTLLFGIIHFLTLPIRPPLLLLVRVVADCFNKQRYNFDKVKKNLELTQPEKPPIYDSGVPAAGFPDHCASRTGEAVDCGLVEREQLARFIQPDGEITRSIDGHRPGPPVSGDMVCGWLFGYTSPWAIGKRPVGALVRLAEWTRKHYEAPTPRMDNGFRRNPLMVGAQGLGPLSLYWTAWRETGDKQWLKRYWWLFIVMGYGWLCIVPTAYGHQPFKWFKWLGDKLSFRVKDHYRVFYNDANCMRCLAVLQRQTKGLHRAFYRLCAWILWTGSKQWHYPFMDFYGLGKVRDTTADYVSWILKNTAECDNLEDKVAPIALPKWGETWDDERYQSNDSFNKQTIGPYFEWFYCTKREF